MACEGAPHCSSSNPFTTFTTCSAPFPATPFPIFLPHIYLLSSTQNKDDRPLRRLFANTPARLFISHPSRHRPTTHLLHQTKLSFFFFFFFPFFRFNLNRCRTTARPSHARRPLRCPRPSRLVVPMHRSSVLSTHASCAHSLPPPLPPGSTTRWVFFYFIFIFLTRTVAGQWRPQPRRPPHAHAGAPARLPLPYPRGAPAPAAAQTVTAPTPSPDRPPPALVAD